MSSHNRTPCQWNLSLTENEWRPQHKQTTQPYRPPLPARPPSQASQWDIRSDLFLSAFSDARRSLRLHRQQRLKHHTCLLYLRRDVSVWMLAKRFWVVHVGQHADILLVRRQWSVLGHVVRRQGGQPDATTSPDIEMQLFHFFISQQYCNLSSHIKARYSLLVLKVPLNPNQSIVSHIVQLEVAAKCNSAKRVKHHIKTHKSTCENAQKIEHTAFLGLITDITSGVQGNSTAWHHLPQRTVHRSFDCSQSYALCSAARGEFVVPRSRLQIGNRAFCVVSLVAWNSLPLDIRSAPILSTFKNMLKT